MTGSSLRLAAAGLPVALLTLAVAFPGHLSAVGSPELPPTGYPIRFELPDLAPKRVVGPLESPVADHVPEGATMEDAPDLPAEMPARVDMEGTASVASNRFGLIAANFRLASPAAMAASDGTSGGVTARKSLRYNANTIGTVELRVADDATIYVNRREVAALLGAETAAGERLIGVEGTMVSLGRLRNAGLVVRYNALEDTLDISDQT